MQELKQRLASPPAELTPAEREVVRALLDDYPRLGLGPMTRLARHAGVSDPTIMRLVKKLGFAGYGDFQEALLADVDDRLRSPRTLLAERRERMGRDDTWARYLDQAGQSLQQTLGLTRPDDIQRLADWLLDSRLRVHCHGGRFSRFLAGYLVTHLRLLRPQCRLLDDGALLPTSSTTSAARTCWSCSTIAATRARPSTWPRPPRHAAHGWCCSPTSTPRRCANTPT